MKTGFLGAGNMGGAILKGYAHAMASATGGDRQMKKNPILVYDSDGEKTAALAALPGIAVCGDMDALVAEADILIIALKPGAFGTVIPQIAEAAGETRKVFVSIAAGISIAWLSAMLGADSKIIRVMPNTPAMVGAGMAALARSATVSDEEFQMVRGIFDAIGRTAAVEESEMDAVIGVSGSSPAYAYMYMEALIDGGIRHGLSPETAKLLAAQTTLGAAKMVLETDVNPKQLRRNVCSPGGTTIEAVQVLEERGLMETVQAAMDAAVAKSKRMTK
jgi:pyrroline-5-carboxylate reductase